MKSKLIVSVVAPFLLVGSMTTAVADTTAAKCELFRHGDLKTEHSGPCQFSQRQGYITIRLTSGKTIELSPGDEPRHYRDKNGHKVKLRDADANSSTYKWDNKRIEVHWNRGGSQSKGSSTEPTTTTKKVHFDAGSNRTDLSGRLTPGSSIRYVLRAKNLQNLYVQVTSRSTDIFYQIFNPDRSFLLDQVSSSKEYRGQLWQSGDHVIEVINRGQNAASYNAFIEIN